MGVKAPGRPITITFFPEQYSARLIFSTSGNPCMTSTEGSLEGAAKARGAPKVAPLTACMPARAARDRVFKSCILVYEEHCAHVCWSPATVSETSMAVQLHKYYMTTCL